LESDEKDIFNAKNVELKVDFIVKGECRYKKSSTVFDVENKKILRPGAGIEEINKL